MGGLGHGLAPVRGLRCLPTADVNFQRGKGGAVGAVHAQALLCLLGVDNHEDPVGAGLGTLVSCGSVYVRPKHRFESNQVHAVLLLLVLGYEPAQLRYPLALAVYWKED